MRLVLLVAHTPHGEVQHRYVARKLAEEFPQELAAIIVATGIRRSVPEKIGRWWKRYSLPQIASRIVARTARKMTGADVRRQLTYRDILFPDGEDGLMPRADILHHVPSHNGPECRALLDRLDPDIVAVYGTLIIGRKLIESARRMVNIHTGFSPIYRGSDTIFWALHNGEPDYVGVTVHRVDTGVDSGAILARGKPAIAPGDDEDRLFAKAVKLGAELLCNALRREAKGAAAPLAQDLSSGREYRTIQRSLAAERKVRKLLKNGLLNKATAAWSEEY